MEDLRFVLRARVPTRWGFAATVTWIPRSSANHPHSAARRTAHYAPSLQLVGSHVSVDHNWSGVELYWPMDSPVIITGPPTGNGSGGGVVRVRHVTGRTFEARSQEWSYLDGAHDVESFGYLALPAGAFRMRDGSQWLAGTFELPVAKSFQRIAFPVELADATSRGDSFFLNGDRGRHYDVGELEMEAGYGFPNRSGFEPVSFREPFEVPPAVFTGCWGSTTGILRVRNVTVKGFEIKMSPEESDSDLGSCFLHWIAIEPGHGVTSGGRSFDVFRATAGSDPVRLVFPRMVPRRSATIIVDVNSYNGSDPVVPRLLHVDARSAVLFLQEEQSLDSETTHLDEEIVIFVGD